MAMCAQTIRGYNLPAIEEPAKTCVFYRVRTEPLSETETPLELCQQAKHHYVPNSRTLPPISEAQPDGWQQ